MTAVLYLGYLGAAANWLIPLAGISNFPNVKPTDVNAGMTATLLAYSGIFCRWSIAISPANYPLFACHLTNATVQALTLLKWGFNVDLSSSSSSASSSSSLPSSSGSSSNTSSNSNSNDNSNSNSNSPPREQ